MKGLDLLIKSIFTIKNQFDQSGWILVIAGIDEKNYKNKLKNMVMKLNLEKIIIFSPPLYDEDKKLAFDQSNAFILPSRSEAMSVVILEALARGLPCIVTKNILFKEFKDYDCGFWCERNISSLSEKIAEIITMKSSLLYSKGLNGKKLIQNKYLWNNIIEEQIKSYESILGR